MTEKQALKTIKKDIDKAEAIGNGLVTTTIGALRKLYQMAEKQIPKRVNYPSGFKIGDRIGYCSCCDATATDIDSYCPYCGQKLDWSEK